MAGKAKRKLDYAGWSTDIFDNDTKIDKLLDAQGWIGFSIYFYLCQKAFGSDGYFYKWGFDDCASTARKMGGGIGSGTVRETVGYCLQIGLFDKRLFEGWGVLTSKGIQRSYWAVARLRRDKSVYKKLWLLETTECEGIVFVPLICDMSATNDDSQSTNVDMSNTNDTVVKSSVVNNNTCAPEPHDSNFAKEEQLKKDFEIIYGIYPKKKGKTVAFANYKQWVGKGKDVGGKKYRLTNRQIYLAVKRYIKQQEEDGKDDLQYWKNFDTLMGRQLLDYVEESDRK
ncbi:MAG: DUF4373 domain-containing protein [Lachnospiraceae bacterium]|nr:DUF4373 domain-containing protein [Lachnospiraceae bacterium]